jgi:hypothetical protein
VVGTCDRDLAGFQRLAQGIERPRIELRKLVQEQHAVMGERDFARLGAQAAADQGRHAGGMMRRTERTAIGERTIGDFAGHRCDHGYFQQLSWGEGREDRR